MSFEDRYVTPTPEGVSLDVVLAGLGSRFAAYLLDFILQVIVFVIFAIVMGLVFPPNNRNNVVLYRGMEFLGYVLIFLGYFVITEMLWSGRSVGKRALGIRVVKTTGVAEGFMSALLRNVGRLIDALPLLNFVGVITIALSANNQRVGDMLAGTIVIRERHAADKVQGRSVAAPAQYWATPVVGSAPGVATGPPLPPQLESWDVSQVSDAEIAIIRQFLSRRWDYTRDARARLAAQLHERIASRVAGDVANLDDEGFLEAVARVKMSRR